MARKRSLGSELQREMERRQRIAAARERSQQQLMTLLTSTLATPLELPFAKLKRSAAVPPFSAGNLDSRCRNRIGQTSLRHHRGC